MQCTIADTDKFLQLVQWELAIKSSELAGEQELVVGLVMASLIVKSGRRPLTPREVNMHSCWQREQVILPGCSWLRSRHASQNVWKHGSTFGLTKVPWQRPHCEEDRLFAALLWLLPPLLPPPQLLLLLLLPLPPRLLLFRWWWLWPFISSVLPITLSPSRLAVLLLLPPLLNDVGDAVSGECADESEWYSFWSISEPNECVLSMEPVDGVGEPIFTAVKSFLQHSQEKNKN